MVDPFDPYRTWLGIPPEEQPPDHYRLLGLARFERDRVAIEAAALQQIASLEAAATGEHAYARLRLILEIRAARSCLLNENRRRGYDQSLERAGAEKAALGPSQQEELELAPLDDEPLRKTRPLQQPATVPGHTVPKPPPPPPKRLPPAGRAGQAAPLAGAAAPDGESSLLDEELAEHFAKLAREEREELGLALSQRKGWRRFFGRKRGKKATIWGPPLIVAAGGLLLVMLLLGIILLQGC